jgi:hypothetical protein
MRALAGSLALALVLATGAWAQRGMGGGFRGGGGGFRGGGGGGFRGGHSGFVGGGFRGGGGFIGGGFRTGGFRGGGFIGGFNRGGFGFRSGFGGRRFGGFGNAFFVPFSWWPGYSFGFGYSSYPSYVWDYGYGYPPPYPAYGYPDIATVSAYQPQQAPVVISQTFPTQTATPVMREYPENGQTPSQPQTAQAAQGPTIYLIAMTDGIIRPALAYWVQGTTLNYLGMDHKQKQVPLDMVDRDFSAQLNRERNVPFKLP